MSDTYLPYVVTEIFCILFTATIFSRLQSEVGSQRELNILKKMVAAYIVMLVTDILWTVVENSPLRSHHLLNATANGISVAAVALGCYFWYQFMEIRMMPAAIPGKTTVRLIRLPVIVICTVDLCSILTGWVFYINSDGSYTEGKLFWLQGVITFAYLIVPTVQAVYMTIKTRDSNKRREYLTCVIYICVCFGVVAVQDSVETVPLFALSIFTVILRLFLTLYLDQEYTLAKKEKELSESRMTMMLSQIQPHFLYNTLSVIQDMCHGKAPDAEEVTVEFAEFLRGNVDSLQMEELIPFSKELNHTRNYLSLEKRRFEDRLTVEYDVETDDFMVPPLTLQPIVENAVRHGVTQQVKGGTVSISVKKKPESYVVIVRDNGIGFDPAASVKDDGRSHIGLANVRERLRMACGGTVTIDSVTGQGTVATITIPRTDSVLFGQ
jgi:two-component sensor histidine kinase